MGIIGKKRTSTEYSQDARKRNWKKVEEFYGGRRCMACGIKSHLPIYELHHHNQEDKQFNVSSIIHHSWEKVEKELYKCILVCSNCHRALHHLERERKR